MLPVFGSLFVRVFFAEVNPIIFYFRLHLFMEDKYSDQVWDCHKCDCDAGEDLKYCCVEKRADEKSGQVDDSKW